MQSSFYPRLLADIGGTNARFGLELSCDMIEHIRVLSCNDYESIIDAIMAYLLQIGEPKIEYAAFAIAKPITNDYMQMTNHHWTFSIETIKQALGLKELILINDFTAQAYSITKINAQDLVQVGGTLGEKYATKAVLGPGTGLGVSGLIPCDDHYIALSGEGGHVSFSPFDDTEVMIWQYAKNKFGHVSAERFLSGAGLVLIYEALAKKDGAKIAEMTPQLISKQALIDKSPLCSLTLDIFCAMLGTVSANLALTLGARGGVYLCGGIIPQFIDYFKKSPFRTRFEDKGRFKAYLAAIPVYVVIARYSGINGVAIALNNYLQKNKGKAWHL